MVDPMELALAALAVFGFFFVRYIVRRERAGKPLWMEKK